jgi:Transmembrane adaptor Erv26
VLVHFIFWADGLPAKEILLSLLCHGVYATMLHKFPHFDPASPPFIGSCIAVIWEHYQWFDYFAHYHYDILEVAGFFLLIVWMTPFGLAVSLSAGENVLPGGSHKLAAYAPTSTATSAATGGAAYSGSGRSAKSVNVFKYLYDSVVDAKNRLFGVDISKRRV